MENEESERKKSHRILRVLIEELAILLNCRIEVDVLCTELLLQESLNGTSLETEYRH